MFPLPVTFAVILADLGPVEIAAWVFPPQRAAEPPLWLVCIPGGSYRGLAYYDRQVPGYPPDAYSMARFLAARGIGLVVIDNLGTGASSLVDVDGSRLTRDVYASAYGQLVADLRASLVSGTLVSGLAPVDAERLYLVGVGHSMGGFLAVHTQAAQTCFDALVLLGWPSAAENVSGIPGIDGDLPTLHQEWAKQADRGYLALPHALLHPFFYSSSVPPELVAADSAEAVPIPVGLLEMMLPGVASDEAARLSCPLFLGFAEVDVTRTPRRDAAAYEAARSLTLFVQPSHHCTNFDATRLDLWREVAAWTRARAVLARGPEAAAFPALASEESAATQPLVV